MSNLSIHQVPNADSSTATSRGGRTNGDGIERDDPALAFDEVMQRHGTRETSPPPGGTERVRSAEQARPAERTPPTDGARPSENTVKRDLAGAPQPTQPTQPVVRSAPVDDGTRASQIVKNPRAATSGPVADNAVEPDATTGDLFADLGLAPVVADTDAAPSTAGSALPTASNEDARNGLLAAARALASPPGSPLAPTVAPTLALVPGADTATLPAQRSAPIDDRTDAAWLTRPGARAPRIINADATVAVPSKFKDNPAQQLLPIEGSPNKRTAVEPELASFAAALDVRGTPAARSEPAPATPLSLSAALSAGSGATLTTIAPPSTFTIAHAQVATTMGAHGFNDEFSQRVVLLAGARVQSAEIALTPADLGPISVTMEVRGQEASLVFGAAQSATRSAIEDALPRLREMFQAHGLHLVDAHVGAQMGHQGRRDGDTSAGAHDARNTLDARTAPIGDVRADAATADGAVLARSNRLIDVRV